MIINLKKSWLFFVCRCILYRDLFAIGIFSIDANKLIFVSSKHYHLLLVNTVCSVNFYPLGTVPIQWIHSDNALILLSTWEQKIQIYQNATRSQV